MPVPDLSQYTLPNHTDLVFLDCAAAFKALTEKEKLYSHYLSQASWYGSLVCLYQVILRDRVHPWASPCAKCPQIGANGPKWVQGVGSHVCKQIQEGQFYV